MLNPENRLTLLKSLIHEELAMITNFAESIIENPSGHPVCVSDVEWSAMDLVQHLKNYVTLSHSVNTGETT